jgi:hypothetical protein
MDSGRLRRKAVAVGHGPARQVVKIRTAKTPPNREFSNLFLSRDAPYNRAPVFTMKGKSWRGESTR